MNLTPEEKEITRVLINEVVILEERKRRIIERLLPFQEKCTHTAVQTADHETFVMVLNGICPDCGKIILPQEVINLIKGNYKPR